MHHMCSCSNTSAKHNETKRYSRAPKVITFPSRNFCELRVNACDAFQLTQRKSATRGLWVLGPRANAIAPLCSQLLSYVCGLRIATRNSNTATHASFSPIFLIVASRSIAFVFVVRVVAAIILFAPATAFVCVSKNVLFPIPPRPRLRNSAPKYVDVECCRMLCVCVGAHVLPATPTIV